MAIPSRRDILRRARYLTATPLVGAAMASSAYQSTILPTLKGSAKSVVIPTHELAGPDGAPFMEERIDFPDGWDVHVQDMAGHSLPVLSSDQIAAQCSTPIGTKSLRELAQGKKTVAITFDDLTRTTPAFDLTTLLVA